MFERRIKIVFIAIFAAMLILPGLAINHQRGKLSEAEKRWLANPPELYQDDGSFNQNFMTDFDTWLNDNLGFRSEMVVQNARMQYHIFHVLPSNSDNILGPNGEFNYVTDAIIREYQHLDLKGEDSLKILSDGFQRAKDYLNNKGIQFYYYQCWDKQSIYPEYFPDTVIQHGEISRIDQNLEALRNATNVTVISPREALIAAKGEYDTYSRWGDASHWTQRGAFIGYQLLMEELNRNNNDRYRILTEADYDITFTDQGQNVFGGIHEEEYLEDFVIKDPKAYKTDEEPVWLADWAKESRQVFYNDSVDNEDTLLILGDSYFDSFLYDDLAESFHKVVLIWGDYTEEFTDIVEYYSPKIVIAENAERCDRTGAFAQSVLDHISY